MCLPRIGKIIALDNGPFRTATVAMNGSAFSVDLMCVPDAEVGTYVMIHAGIALAVLSDSEAHERLELLEQVRYGVTEDGG